MMAEGTIVPCTSPEHEGWLALRRQLWPDYPLESLPKEMATMCSAPERFAQYLFVSNRGETLGFIEVALRNDNVNGTSTSPVAFLEGIFVAASARRQGIARALIATAAQWARSRGCAEFASDALLENDASQDMHRALGFQETERVVYFCKPLR